MSTKVVSCIEAMLTKFQYKFLIFAMRVVCQAVFTICVC